jgi:hypothetical protein
VEADFELELVQHVVLAKPAAHAPDLDARRSKLGSVPSGRHLILHIRSLEPLEVPRKAQRSRRSREMFDIGPMAELDSPDFVHVLALRQLLMLAPHTLKW